MPPLTWTDARAVVIREVLREVRENRGTAGKEIVTLDAASGRILASGEQSRADRDYPPFNRSTRDGFAIRHQDIPGRLRVIGEARAGQPFNGEIVPGEAIEIMTGAPVPASATAIVMVEHTVRHDDGSVETNRSQSDGANIAIQGCEARAGEPALHTGDRVDYTGIAWLATIGRTAVEVFRRPRVAILSTGDEVVPVDTDPLPHQIRNSNAHALAAQVRRAGGEPWILPVAPDDKTATAALISEGLDADLLLLSGGVSAGKFDFVEPALASLGAQFYFDRVLIQPGQPLVFGRCRSKFFFGLPGNPGSTMVTFELFARAAIELIGGANDSAPGIMLAKLTQPFRHKPGIARFLPAWVARGEVTPVPWKGSGDIPAWIRANAMLIADADTPEYPAGGLIQILPK